MGDDEESLLVCCATNDGDQLLRFQNPMSITFDNFQGSWSLQSIVQNPCLHYKQQNLIALTFSN